MSLARYLEKRKIINEKRAFEIYKHRVCYLFLAPYAIVFILFFVAPLVISVFYSFTYFNVLEPPRFIGLRNYINLLLGDDVFLIAVKNTFIIAVITGPVGFIMAFLFAWFINELPRYIRAFVTLVFYAPSIAGSAYMIWGLLFNGDAYGYINGFLINNGILDSPVLWLTDPKFMMPVILVVVLWMSLGAAFLAFIAGLSTIDPTLYEAGVVDGISNRWQELWYITLPNMKGMLMFGAVMAITQAFGVAEVTIVLAGQPSTDYAVHTVVNHLIDYGSIRFEMGYACAIATILFFIMIVCYFVTQKMLRRIGT